MPTPPLHPSPTLHPLSSAETIGGSNDILTEILSFLPIKPLIRLKTINKQLNSLISDPTFCLLQTLRHPYHPPSALFFLRHHSLSSSPSFHFVSLSPPFHLLPPPHPSPSNITQSSNGLLLCWSKPDPDNTTHFLVHNPTMGRSVSITPPRHVTQSHEVVGVSLAYDPSRWAHFHVVCVYSLKKDKYAVDVYLSSTRQWRGGMEVEVPTPFDVEFERGVYWGGKVFWLSHTDSTVYYDVESECVERLSLPKAVEGAYMERFRYFGECCGHLHLIEIRTNCVQKFNVLELEEKGEDGLEWVVKYRVDLELLGRGFESEMFQDHNDRFGRGFRFYAFSILAVVRSKQGDDNVDDEESALVISIPGKVISYSFKSKVSKLLCNVVDDSDKWFPFRGYTAFPYIESLYCV